MVMEAASTSMVTSSVVAELFAASTKISSKIL
jgi:hypothetical protein